MDRFGEAPTRGTLTTGRLGPRPPVPPTGRGRAVPPGLPHGVLLGPPSRPISSWPDATGLPAALHLDTNARPPVVEQDEAPGPATTGRSRDPLVLAPALGALAGLLLSCVAVLLPWHGAEAADATGIAGTAFGIGILVACAGLLATVVVDLLERRVRWLALVAAPPVALLSVVLVATVAAGISGAAISTQLALAGLPWPGPVVSGLGVWLFGFGQLACLVVGGTAVVGWLRGWGNDEPAAPPSPRRPLAVALCASAAVLVVVISGVLLAQAAPLPQAAPAPATTTTGGVG